jgi:two-component system, chemotaxis family, sensor kinase CheA
MEINRERFEQIFFEEAFEGLEILESGLLALANGGGSAIIDDIFRAAHSIKGGSGTFGFSDITSLTHFLETLLDDLRSGTRLVEPDLTQLLLEGADGLRYLLETRSDGQTPDLGRIAGVLDQLSQWTVAGPRGSSEESIAVSRELQGRELQGRELQGRELQGRELQAAVRSWRLGFRPHRNLLLTGNEPLRILEELAELGDLVPEADTSAVPPLSSLDAEQLYLGWNLGLRTESPERAIREVFAWVEDHCDLEIEVAPNPEMVRPMVEESAAAPAKLVLSESGTRRGATEGASIRVSTDKVDSVINLVGELVITQSMLSCLGEKFEMRMMDRLRDGLAQLDRNTRELQATVLKMRMLPMSFCFQRFPRLVHDVGEKLGKKVSLRLVGEQTEIDKTVLERISDPMVHLVRNALDHGIEMPEKRLAAGKPEFGTLSLEASHEGGNILLVISDDGAGLDPERILRKAVERGLVGPADNLSEQRIHELIFLPGFSTAEKVTELSGRGVGMDVVRRNIEELGGSIEISSRKGKGSQFRIRLPLTLSILDGQLVQVGAQTYVIPLTSIVESIQLRRAGIHHLAQGEVVYRFREDYLPLICLEELMAESGARSVGNLQESLTERLLVVVETHARPVGLLVDDLLGQQQVVIKSLEQNFQKVEGLSGATILGDGQVAMILDVEGVVRLAGARNRRKGQAQTRLEPALAGVIGSDR